jgi:hypothetical protein
VSPLKPFNGTGDVGNMAVAANPVNIQTGCENRQCLPSGTESRLSAMKLTDQIRARLKATGLSDNALHEETGITRSTLHEFLEGTRMLGGKNLDKVFDFLGQPRITFPEIQVRERKPGKPKKSKKG